MLGDQVRYRLSFLWNKEEVKWYVVAIECIADVLLILVQSFATFQQCQFISCDPGSKRHWVSASSNVRGKSSRSDSDWLKLRWTDWFQNLLDKFTLKQIAKMDAQSEKSWFVKLCLIGFKNYFELCVSKQMLPKWHWNDNENKLMSFCKVLFFQM